MSGRLTLVGTPIGNLGDLAPRARESLLEADGWIVEDTRVSGKLQSIFEARKPMRVLNEHTPDHAVEKLLAELEEGANLCLLTDGGMPAISDPGARLTDRCHEAGVAVTAVPGPSAVPTALALSGFFAQRFAFLGFLGRKPGDIRKELASFADSPYTLVLFESPYRIDTFLKTAHEALGERRYALCREITKLHEQTYRDRLPTIPPETVVPRKGEFTVVIEGRRKPERD